MGKRTVCVALVAAMTASFIAVTASSAAASTGTDESSFISRINRERSSRGLRTLSVASSLTYYARKHSREMAARGEIYHSSNSQLSSAGGSDWTEMGENVGVGPDVSSLHSAFMNSPSHRDNILHRAYNQIGVGVVYGSDGNIYVTEIFKAGTVRTRTVTKTVARTTTTRSVAPARARTVAAAAPKPKPAVAPPDPRTVDLLIRMIGMDSSVNPTTGDVAGI
jgi:hypothetical protein